MICYFLYTSLSTSLPSYVCISTEQTSKQIFNLGTCRVSVRVRVSNAMPNKTIPILYLLTFEFPYLLPPTNIQGTSTSLPRTFSPDFRIDNLKTLVSTQSRPLISFLKFSLCSFLLTRHASLSHSDRREGGEFNFLCMQSSHLYAYHSLSYFLFFSFYTSVRPLALSRNSNSN